MVRKSLLMAGVKNTEDLRELMNTFPKVEGGVDFCDRYIESYKRFFEEGRERDTERALLIVLPVLYKRLNDLHVVKRHLAGENVERSDVTSYKELGEGDWLYRTVRAIAGFIYKTSSELKVSNHGPLTKYELPEGYRWHGRLTGEWSNILLVRTAYEELVDAAINPTMYYSPYSRSLGRGRQLKPECGMGAVVVGTPGIGKSAFLNYCLMRLLRLGKVVIWEDTANDDTTRHRIQIWKPERKGDEPRIHIQEAVEKNGCVVFNEERKVNSELWMLIDPANEGDAAKKEPHHPPTFASNVILATSPDIARYDHFIGKRMMTSRFFMYVWTKAELEQAAALLGLADRVESSFRLAGGVVRALFMREEELERKLEDALRNPSLRNHMIELATGQLRDAGKASHRLLHYVKPRNFEHNKFRTVEYDFASIEARRRFLLHKAATYSPEDLTSFLTGVFRHNGSAAGILYEKAFPVIEKGRPFELIRFDPFQLLQDSKRYTGAVVQEMQQASGRSLEFELDMRECKAQWNEQRPLERVAEAINNGESCAYINPDRQTYPQVDAFYVEENGGLLTLLQMTIADLHTFNPKEVDEQLKKIKAMLHPRCKKRLKMRFLFVVLHKHVDDFRVEVRGDCSKRLRGLFSTNTFLVSFL